MRGTVQFQNKIRVIYTLETLEGEEYVNYVLTGLCAIAPERKGVRIEGFLFPYRVYFEQIEPHLQWTKVHITQTDPTLVKAV
jgi:hypothetical protein